MEYYAGAGGWALRGVLYDAWTHLHTSCFISTICQMNKHLLGPVLLKWRDFFPAWEVFTEQSFPAWEVFTEQSMER